MYACSHSGQIMLLFVMYVWDYNYCTLSPICVKTYNMHYDCFIKWLNYRGLVSLTQWDPDNMDDIPQISFSHAFLQSFSMLEFSYNFHWRQSLNDKITISQLRLRLSVVAELYPSHYPKRRWPHLLTQCVYIYIHTYICIVCTLGAELIMYYWSSNWDSPWCLPLCSNWSCYHGPSY